MISDVEEESVAFPATFLFNGAVRDPLDVHEHGERCSDGMCTDVRHRDGGAAVPVCPFQRLNDV